MKRRSQLSLLSGILNRSTDAGKERYRKAAYTSLMNVASQVLQLATGLISVPLALGYIGGERFGIWMTLSAALAFITFSDFGIGIGTQDRMTIHLSSDRFDLARRSFFSSFFFVVILVILLVGASKFVVPSIGLPSLLSLKSMAAINEVVPAAEVVVLVLGIGLLAGIVQRAFIALQEGFIVSLIQSIFRLVALGLLFVVVELEMGLPALIFVVGGFASLGLLLVGIPVLFFRHEWLRPRHKSWLTEFDFSCLKGALRVGILGLAASIAIYLVSNSGLVLMSGKYGAESVADYAVLLKLVGVPTLLLVYLIHPLWPAITEAKSTGDMAWVKKTYEHCRRVTIVFAVGCSLVLLLWGQQIIEMWTGSISVVPGTRLLIASVVFMVLGFWNALTSVILNGLSRYKGQATYGLGLATGFAVLALLVPVSYEKDVIIWVVAVGFFIRCVLMQIEVNLNLGSK